MRESWTDGRLDDLNARVDQRFDQVDKRFDRVEAEARALRVEMRTEFAVLRGEMKAGFELVDGHSQRMEERFDAMHRLLIQFCGLMSAALFGVIASLVGLIVTQL